MTVCHECLSKHKTHISQKDKNYKTSGNMGRIRVQHDATNGNFTTIATKISLADKVRLSRIADGFNMTLYEMMQALLLGMARYFDKGNIMTDEGNSLLNAIGNIMFTTKGSFSPMALRDRKQQRVNNAILFLQRKENQRPQLTEIHIDSYGNMVESYNFDTMLSIFLNCIDPDVLQCLKSEAKRNGYFSITHTLHQLIMQRTATHEETIADEVREMFTDERIPTGQRINEDIYYRGKHNRGDYTTITQNKTYRADL